MTSKGLHVLDALTRKFPSEIFGFVSTARDLAVEYDAFDEIKELAVKKGIPVFTREQADKSLSIRYAFAIGWRWLIPQCKSRDVIIFHDSLLPKYRGFAPLVSALVNGEHQVGVTALFATQQYDCGPVIGQELINIEYPIKISGAIKKIENCYEVLAMKTMAKIFSNELKTNPQDESKATYSLWRDEKDYAINWIWDSARIRRFVDAVGYPYKGAFSKVDGIPCRVINCEEIPDVFIENRVPGKTIFVNDGKPVVVCGTGLVRILELKNAETMDDMLPIKKFRLRFE